MRKIKDNGRTYKEVDAVCNSACDHCERQCTKEDDRDCGADYYWRETLPSKLSRLIKRMVRK